MPIGLNRGVVELADHDPEWEQLARETIERLWQVLGSTIVPTPTKIGTSSLSIAMSTLAHGHIMFMWFDQKVTLGMHLSAFVTT